MNVRSIGAAAVLTTCLFASRTAAQTHDAATLWIEAETATHDFRHPAGFAAARMRSLAPLLSGGEWLTHEGNADTPPRMRLPVEVAVDGEYRVFARRFWKHGSFRWRVDDGPWRAFDADTALLDWVQLDDKFLCANWVHMGAVAMRSGTRTLEIELTLANGSGVAAFDCFVLTQGAFEPRGLLRPGERATPAAPGWFAYDPQEGATDFGAIDLRDRNEREAGMHGFVRRDGDGFVLGDGRPVRFFGVNVDSGIARAGADVVDAMVRRLAGAGVNLIRFHSPVFDAQREGAPLDDGRVAAVHDLQAACRRHGVYLALSTWFPLWLPARPEVGLPGYPADGSGRPFARTFVDPTFRARQTDWLLGVLRSRNPHLDRQVGADPSLAFVELVNEDSVLFWTFGPDSMPASDWRDVERQFGAYLGKRHSSLRSAFARLGGHPNDDLAAGRAGLDGIWHLTRDGIASGGPKVRQRRSEQLRFLVELQRDAYAEMVASVRAERSFRSLIVCGNWITADAAQLGPLESFTYTVGDALDAHGYFGGTHEGPRASYAVDVGDRFEDRSWTRSPVPSPLAVPQVAGFPQLISELGWPQPNRFRAEMVPLSTALAGVQGIDGLVFFAVVTPTLRDTIPTKFSITSPASLLTWPAAALAYRRFDIAPTIAALHERRGLEELLRFRGSGVAPAPALDALRAADGPRTDATRLVDPRWFALGPIVREFTAGAERRAPWFAQATKGPLLSSPYGVTVDPRGVVTIDTERTRGAIGFLKAAGRIELSGLTIDADVEYATVLVTSLDDLDLAQSRRVLVQVVTEDRARGASTEGGRITALGGYPFDVRRHDVRVGWRTAPGRMQATPLDQTGRPRTDVPPIDAGDGTLSFTLRDDAPWHVVELRR